MSCRALSSGLIGEAGVLPAQGLAFGVRRGDRETHHQKSTPTLSYTEESISPTMHCIFLGDNERTGIPADGHPGGTSGALGVKRPRPRANGQRWGGGERGETDGFVRRNHLVR